MSYFPDCRTDEYYNQKYLTQRNKDFVAGYDYALEQVQNLFNNLEVFPDLEQLLDDNVALVKEHKVDMVQTCIEDWAEMNRDELITSMIDSMDENEYQEIKQRVDADDGEG